MFNSNPFPSIYDILKGLVYPHRRSGLAQLGENGPVAVPPRFSPQMVAFEGKSEAPRHTNLLLVSTQWKRSYESFIKPEPYEILQELYT